MKWAFENEFRLDKPETIGETDYEFDLDNYKEWLEKQLANERLKTAKMKANGATTSDESLPIAGVVKQSEQLTCVVDSCENKRIKSPYHKYCIKHRIRKG